MYHQPNRRKTGQAQALRHLPAVLATLGLSLGVLSQTAQAAQVDHGVAAAILKVDQNGGPANTNVAVTATLNFGLYPIKADLWTDANISEVPFLVWNSADYYVTTNRNWVYGGSTNTPKTDVLSGVLFASVAENERYNLTADDGYLTNGACIATVDESALGQAGWRIATARSTGSGAGKSAEHNINVAAAWFPYDKFLGGLARNSLRKNGGTNTTDQAYYAVDYLYGSPGLVMSNHFLYFGPGVYGVDLTSFGIDSHTDGVLLVSGGKDEANYGLSQANPTNGTWNVFIHDMSHATAGTMEEDPVAFVYIPRTNSSLISGKFNGDGSIALYSDASPRFTATPLSEGNFELKITGHSPKTGVLIISAEGGGTYNLDNIVTYQSNAAGDGWIIQTRDTPGMGFQTPTAADGGPEPVCSFVFVPAPTTGVTVNPASNVQTTEAGGTGTFAVVLDTMPTADVTMAVSSSDVTEGTVSVSSLVFTPENWDLPQTVTVAGQDDASIDGQIAYSIVLGVITSADTNYNGLNPADISAFNSDNEGGVTITAEALSTTEAGGTAAFTIALNTAPTANVTIGLSSSDTTEGTVSPSSVTFTPANWATPQTVTATGVDDFLDDGDAAYTIVTAAATSTDAAYSGFNAIDPSVVNLDNDSASVTVSAESVTVNEGATANFTVVLATEPTGNVTVNMTASDNTQASVTSALTFTPANWNVAQQAVVTGVDDAVNDGNVASTITFSITGADPVYSALSVASVAVMTFDNEAAITLSSGSTYYGLGSPAIGVDGGAAIIDESANYNGGNLTVTVASGSASDVLSVRNLGTGPGQIGINGANVSYEGTVVGTVVGGNGTPLVVTLNAQATPAAAQALMRAVAYQSTLTGAVKQTRTVTFALADGAGGTSSASKAVQVGLVNVYEFQNGIDSGFGPYEAAADIEIREGDPYYAMPIGEDTNNWYMWLDYRLGDISQVLMRFDNIIGTELGQVPTNCQIISAELVLTVPNSGHGGVFHRMLIPWDATNETWASVAWGVQQDDVESLSVSNVTWGAFMKPDGTYSGTSGSGRMAIGVTPDVEAWASGQTNYGWVIRPWDFADNGTGFNPCEYTNVLNRPMLRITWIPKDTAATSFRQGVNGYTGTVDTQIRTPTPDNDYSATANLFVDYEITSGKPDSQSVLLRFDDIIGDTAGQIPANALIHKAVLELHSTFPDSMGDGGEFHALLQPWTAAATWNTWVNGIQADGIEAAVNVSAYAGNLTRNPDVQSGLNTFDVTADIQSWVAGSPNYGWAILPLYLGGNGWGINSSEWEEVYRPRLKVYYTPGALPENIALEAPVYSAGQVQFKFSGNANRTYTIQRVGALGQTWSNAGTATTDGTGKGTFTDANPLTGAGFYRVIYP